MLLVIDGKPRGIRCDITGREFFDKFSYYSLEGKSVTVDSPKKVSSRSTETTLDLDLCEEAYNDLYDKVKRNLGPLRPGTVKCDMSARYLTGKFTYWTVVAALIQVDLENTEPMKVTSGIFDLNVSKEEVDALMDTRHKNRAKPFIPPKQEVPKKEVLKIVPPKQPKVETPELPAPPPPETKKAPAIPEPVVELEPQEIQMPDTRIPRNVKKRKPK